MILNISHRDKLKYREATKSKPVRARKKRSSLLKQKSKDAAFKEFEEFGETNLSSEVQVDEHVKLNDNFMRTGPYRPKKK